MKTNYIIIGVIIALIATGIFIFTQEEPTPSFYQYSNGYSTFDVTIVSDTETKIPITLKGDPQVYEIVLRNDPKSVEDIPLYGNLNQRIANDEVVFISIDPLQNLGSKTVLAVYEIEKFITNELLYDTEVYTTMATPYQEKIVRNCDHATDTQTVILVTLGDETQVYGSDYCIVVMGTDEDEIIKAANRLAYHLIGIMP